jgi:hypothetical protein
MVLVIVSFLIFSELFSDAFGFSFSNTIADIWGVLNYDDDNFILRKLFLRL